MVALIQDLGLFKTNKYMLAANTDLV